MSTVHVRKPCFLPCIVHFIMITVQYSRINVILGLEAVATVEQETGYPTPIEKSLSEHYHAGVCRFVLY